MGNALKHEVQGNGKPSGGRDDASERTHAHGSTLCGPSRHLYEKNSEVCISWMFNVVHCIISFNLKLFRSGLEIRS